MYPGPYKLIIKPKINRQKVSKQKLVRLLSFMNSPGYIQRVAFGVKVQEVLGGLDNVTLDNLARTAPLHKITKDFLLSIEEEASYNKDIPRSDLRCQCLERGTFRRCLLPRNHKAEGICKCKFTPKGSVCSRTIEDFVKSLTGGQIKSLSGLDDIKEIKGRRSFQELRVLAEKYCQKSEDIKRLIGKIDETEIFYQTDFGTHLQEHSDYSCACLTCGYSVSYYL